MPGQGQVQLPGRDAATIIADLDQAAARIEHGDRYGMGTGIQRIFKQFFDHRGGAFDHLTGCDLGSNFRGQDMNGHVPIIRFFLYNTCMP
jgi:hypothetical protein